MSDETTSEQIAEIEGQAADYTPPEDWRVLQAGEVIAAGDRWVRPADKQAFYALRIGEIVRDGTFIRRIEPQPEPQPEPEPEPQAEPQPVQVREGRWRTRNGEIRHVTRTPKARLNADRFSWHDSHYNQTWLPSGRYHLGGDSLFDLLEYLGPIEPEPQQIITPDDVAAEDLRQKLETTEAALLEQQQQNERLVTHSSQQHMEIAELQAQVRFLKNRELTLGTRLEEEKAVTTKRLQQVELMRSEVSYVQGLLGEEKRRVAELETLVKDLRNINATAEKSVEAAARDKADLQHRLDVVSSEWALQAETIRGLESLLEAVKAELVRQCENSRLLQIELDAYELRSHNVSDRFEEGWDAGTVRAVETIAEWTAPIRTCGSQAFALEVLQNLPHIMRSLTGLADND